jgi:hypothetical protein
MPGSMALEVGNFAGEPHGRQTGFEKRFDLLCESRNRQSFIPIFSDCFTKGKSRRFGAGGIKAKTIQNNVSYFY